MASGKSGELVQAGSFALAGIVLPEILGSHILWVMGAVGGCLWADVHTPAGGARTHMVRRYVSSLMVVLTLSYGVGSVMHALQPEWFGGDPWTARMIAGAALGMLLHRIVATASDGMGRALDKVLPKRDAKAPEGDRQP